MECVPCVWLGAGWEVLECVGDRIGFGRNMGKVGYVYVFRLRWCGWYWRRVSGRHWPWSGRMGWCFVCVCCESGLSVLMAGPGICILC